MVSRSSHWCLSHIDRKKSTGDQHLKCSFEGVDVFLSTSVQDLRVVQSITIWLQLCPLPSCLCYHCIPCHWGELWCCKHTSGHGTCKPQIGTQHSTKAPSRHKLWKNVLRTNVQRCRSQSSARPRKRSSVFLWADFDVHLILKQIILSLNRKSSKRRHGSILNDQKFDSWTPKRDQSFQVWNSGPSPHLSKLQCPVSMNFSLGWFLRSSHWWRRPWDSQRSRCSATWCRAAHGKGDSGTPRP